MDSVFAYFSAHPAVFTLLVIVFIIMILSFILSKLIKVTIAVVIIVLLAGGFYLLKDPATKNDKIKETVSTFKTGGEQIGDKFSSFWQDTKRLAGKAKDAPGEIDKMLDTAKKDVKK